MNILEADANNPVESGFVTYSDPPPYSAKQTGGIDDITGSYLDLSSENARVQSVTGFMHCHLNNATIKNFAVFSLDDLISFAKLVQNSTVPSDQLTMYVTSNKGTFAMKIKDKVGFINAINSITPNLYSVYDSMFSTKVKNYKNSNDQAKGLIEFFKSSGLSTSEVFELYQSDSAFKNWKKLSLDPITNILTPTNC